MIDFSIKGDLHGNELATTLTVWSTGKDPVRVLIGYLTSPDGHSQEVLPTQDCSSHCIRISPEGFGQGMWFRAGIWYADTETRVLIKDFLLVANEGEDTIHPVQAIVREHEALGCQAFSTQDYAAANVHFERAFSAYEAEGNEFAVNQLLLIYSSSLSTLGSLDEAGFRLRSTLAGRRESAASLGLLSNLAGVLLRQGQSFPAKQVFDEVIASASRLGMAKMVGVAQAGVGMCLKAQGRLAEAEFWTQEAIATGRSENDLFGLSRRLRTMSELLIERKEFERAVATLSEAIDSSVRLHDFEEAEILFPLLWTAAKGAGNLGAFIRAGEMFLESVPADAIEETRSHVLNAVATAYGCINAFPRAISVLGLALEIARRRQDNPGIVTILINKGNYLKAMKETASASGAFREAMTIAAEAGVFGLAAMCKRDLVSMLDDQSSVKEREAIETEYGQLVSNWWFSQDPSPSDFEVARVWAHPL
jgi:tetratricopeptide (TPR) repeat protein